LPQTSVHGLKQNIKNPQKSTLGKKNYGNFGKKTIYGKCIKND